MSDVSTSRRIDSLRHCVCRNVYVPHIIFESIMLESSIERDHVESIESFQRSLRNLRVSKLIQRDFC